MSSMLIKVAVVLFLIAIIDLDHGETRPAQSSNSSKLKNESDTKDCHKFEIPVSDCNRLVKKAVQMSKGNRTISALHVGQFTLSKLEKGRYEYNIQMEVHFDNNVIPQKCHFGATEHPDIVPVIDNHYRVNCLEEAKVKPRKF